MGVGIQEEGWVCWGQGIQEGGGGYASWDRYTPRLGILTPILTPSGGHQNMYGWQAGVSHYLCFDKATFEDEL